MHYKFVTMVLQGATGIASDRTVVEYCRVVLTQKQMDVSVQVFLILKFYEVQNDKILQRIMMEVTCGIRVSKHL